MISKLSENPALVLVDIQKGFDDVALWGGERNNPDAEEKAGQLLQFWRKKQWPVFHVKHCSVHPDSPLNEANSGNAFNDFVMPAGDEPVIKKNVNSAFIGTNLKEQLENKGINTLVIAGLTTDHCISTTVRMAGNLGFNTFVVSDATATFSKKGIDGKELSASLMHETALASLNEEFATVVSIKHIIE